MEQGPVIQPDFLTTAKPISTQNGAGGVEESGEFNSLLSGKLDQNTQQTSTTTRKRNATPRANNRTPHNENDETAEYTFSAITENTTIPDLDGKLPDNSTAIHTIEIPPLNLSRKQLSIQGMDIATNQTGSNGEANQGLLVQNIARILDKATESQVEAQAGMATGSGKPSASTPFLRAAGGDAQTQASLTSSGSSTALQATMGGEDMDVRIESWSAVFSNQSTTGNQGAEQGSVLASKGRISPPNMVETAPTQTSGTNEDDPLTGMTIESGKQQMDLAPGLDGEMQNRASSVRSDSLPRALRHDSNSQYIQSRLPEPNSTLNAGQTNGQAADNGAEAFNRMLASQSQDPTTGLEDTDPGSTPFTLEQTTATSNQAETMGVKSPAALEINESRILDQVLDRFTMQRRLESGSVSLQLHPEELGELKLQIQIDRDNVKAHIVTENPQVQEILERQIPRLRDALAEHGFHLDNMEVSVAAEDSAFHFFQENHTKADDQQQRPASTPSRLFEVVEDDPRPNHSSASEGLSVHA